MEKEFFDLLGLGVPFYLAAATYAVFYWLDDNASDEATKVISSWLHGRSRNKPDLGNLIISAFDRIYTSPLLTFRAFRRSAAISVAACLMINIIPWFLLEYQNGTFFITYGIDAVVGDIAMLLFFAVLSDYVSLPFVRGFLELAKTYPIRASVISSIVGLIVITMNILIFLCLFIVITYFLLNPQESIEMIPKHSIFEFVKLLEIALRSGTGIVEITRCALIVHLWLPLFALSSLAVRLFFWIFRAVEKAQWFLKQGDAHPLKAIGIVATIIVFGSAMLVKEGWALLSVME